MFICLRHFDYVPQDYDRRERRLFACDSMKHCAVVFALFLFLAVIWQSAVTQFSCSVFRVDFRRSLPSGLRSSGGQIGDIRVSGSSSPPSLLTFVRRILMKWGGLRASSVISLPLGFRIDGLFPRRKNSACKSFYQYVLVPLSSNRHKLGRQNAQDGSSVKKKKVCLMSIES